VAGIHDKQLVGAAVTNRRVVGALVGSRILAHPEVAAELATSLAEVESTSLFTAPTLLTRQDGYFHVSGVVRPINSAESSPKLRQLRSRRRRFSRRSRCPRPRN